MANGITKRIVVIKDIPSNFIEEAILILKGDVPAVESSDGKGMAKTSAKRYNDFLVKEAYSVINNYIKESKLHDRSDSKPVDKSSVLKRKFFTNTAINLALAGSIALLVFIIAKVI